MILYYPGVLVNCKKMSSGNPNISFFIPDDENDILDSTVIQGITTKTPSITDKEYYTCYIFGPKDFDEIQTIDFYLNGIIGFPLGLLGILNNLIFVGVLTRTPMRRSIFNKLLVGFSSKLSLLFNKLNWMRVLCQTKSIFFPDQFCHLEHLVSDELDNSY